MFSHRVRDRIETQRDLDKPAQLQHEVLRACPVEIKRNVALPGRFRRSYPVDHDELLGGYPEQVRRVMLQPLSEHGIMLGDRVCELKAKTHRVLL